MSDASTNNPRLALKASIEAILNCVDSSCIVSVVRVPWSPSPPPPAVPPVPPVQPSWFAPARGRRLGDAGPVDDEAGDFASNEELNVAARPTAPPPSSAPAPSPPYQFDLHVVWLLPNTTAISSDDKYRENPRTMEAARDAAVATLTSLSTAALNAALQLQGMPPSLELAYKPAFTPMREVRDFYVPPSPPPSPPSPPPPSLPPQRPQPPSPPPGLCSDVCNEQGGTTGVCNDGGEGAHAGAAGSMCVYGSDCSDCGVRIFCVDCPSECAAAAYADPLNYGCMQSMWGDGICDPQCNNLACDHNDCTSDQIMDKCLAEQDISGIGISDAPRSANVPEGRLVPINLQLDLAPARLEVRTEINEMVLSQEVEFVMQWQDSRMGETPCKAVLSDLLSLSREEANSDLQRNIKWEYRKRFWMPKLDALSLVPGYYAWVEEASFVYEDEGEWIAGLAPDLS